MKDSIHDIVMPDLQLPEVQATLCIWLVPRGGNVLAGDRVVEILAGDVTVDLPAPADGVLVQQLVAEDDPVRPGQVLGRVRSRAREMK